MPLSPDDLKALTASLVAAFQSGEIDLSVAAPERLGADQDSYGDGDGDDFAALSDAELNDLIASLDDEDDDDGQRPETDRVSTETNLSHEEREAIDLANARADQAAEQVRALQVDLAAQRWETERAGYVGQGVPPAIVDLAAPLLSRPEDVVIDLANGQGVLGASEIVRNLLNAVTGFVDLAMERGHSVDLGTSEQDDVLLAAWSAQS